MRFEHKGLNILFDENVIELLTSFKQFDNKNESGGILLGIVSETDVIIKKASIPTEFDKGSRFRFTRHKKSAQIITDYEFHNSGGKIIYIGEWHTHPENFPSPSNTDLNMIKTQHKKNRINESFLLMLIVGFKGFYLGLYDGKKIYNLKTK